MMLCVQLVLEQPTKERKNVMKKVDPDAPLSDEEWNAVTPMRGIDGLPRSSSAGSQEHNSGQTSFSESQRKGYLPSGRCCNSLHSRNWEGNMLFLMCNHVPIKRNQCPCVT